MPCPVFFAAARWSSLFRGSNRFPPLCIPACVISFHSVPIGRCDLLDCRDGITYCNFWRRIRHPLQVVIVSPIGLRFFVFITVAAFALALGALIFCVAILSPTGIASFWTRCSALRWPVSLSAVPPVIRWESVVSIIQTIIILLFTPCLHN